MGNVSADGKGQVVLVVGRRSSCALDGVAAPPRVGAGAGAGVMAGAGAAAGVRAGIGAGAGASADGDAGTDVEGCTTDRFISLETRAGAPRLADAGRPEADGAAVGAVGFFGLKMRERTKIMRRL